MAIIMTDKEKYNKALEYAEKMHEGQFRIGGKPYISHPIAVAEIIINKGLPADYAITALFHDLLEDTQASEKEILSLSNKDVTEAVVLLTKRKGYIMKEYIDAIKKNDMAFQVKAADRLHNLKSAVCADESFKHKYILETVDWYLDFSDEIRVAVKELADTLETPMIELPFIYEPIETWKIKGE